MCPSVNSYEKGFYQELIGLAKKQQKAFPIAISVSGLWLLKHPKEFAYIVKQQQQNLLNITWINHTFNHNYFHDLPIKQNFLLSKVTNFYDEVFSLEKLLLMHNQIPSVFIRYPGLVSDRNILSETQKLGLIPVGSDAWLAKSQKPRNGSIILVHGNGNEHLGIVKIMPILQDSSQNWLPLSQAILN